MSLGVAQLLFGFALELLVGTPILVEILLRRSQGEQNLLPLVSLMSWILDPKLLLN